MKLRFWRGKKNEELDAEIGAHLEASIRERMERGATRTEAEAAARREFGNVALVKDTTRDVWGFRWLDDLAQDLRYAARQLRRNPGFTVVAVITLALGVGANTAIFSLVDGVLLRPLPYAEPERLVTYLQSYPSVGLNRWGISQFLFATFRDQARSFERSAAHTSAGVNLTGGQESVRLQAAYVTAGLFEVLGVNPAMGRTFRTEEDVPGKNIVCILSDQLWRDRFGSDPQIVGKSLLLDGAPLQVVGVMPPGFGFPSRETDLWIPLGLNPERRFGFMFSGIARLKEGVSPPQAEAELTGIQWNQARQTADPPPAGADLKMLVTPLHEAVTRNAAKPLLVLLGAVGFVLLIACANIANLLLGRVTVRRREIALRITLGAAPRRVVRQLLTESLLLAVLGATLGVLLAVWIVALIGRLPLEGIPRIAEVQVNLPALWFTAGLAVVTGILFGLAPALRAYQIGLSDGLGDGVRATATVSSRRVNNSLVAAQVALSIVLLVGAGLMLKSFAQLLAVDPGFQVENVLTMRLSLSGERYALGEAMFQFYDGLVERVRALPGVRAVGMVTKLPIHSAGGDADGYVVEGHETSGFVKPNSLMLVTYPGYFQAMGIPLLRGRDFTSADNNDSERVAIIDETFARRYWPDGNALGKRIRFGWDTSERAWMTVVGVAGNVKHAGLAEVGYPHMYMAYRQQEERLQQMFLAVRTTSDPAAATAAIREHVRQLDSNVPVFAVRTMSAIVAESLNSQRLTNLLLGSFAAIALLLAAVGIYGVMSLNVTGRTQEFGIRVALGAQQRDVFTSVVGHAMRITAAGMAVGAVVALGVTQLLATLLFEVSPLDPVVFACVAGVLGATSFAACYLPARRAARVDPMVALRHE